MKPATPITNPAFRYTNAASTDIRATWARFGWKQKPRFENVSCSQCGAEFGPGDNGFSHCANHAHLKGKK